MRILPLFHSSGIFIYFTSYNLMLIIQVIVEEVVFIYLYGPISTINHHEQELGYVQQTMVQHL